MSKEESYEKDFALSEITYPTTSIQSGGIRPKWHIARNPLLVWLDTNIDQSKQECQKTLAQLRSIVNDVDVYTERDECIDFLTDINDMKTFLIVEGSIGQEIIPLVHNFIQLHAIYILCSNNLGTEQWTQEWTKVKGVHTEMTLICESLRETMKQCNQDDIALSFFAIGEETSVRDLDQLEPSFMYTQIFKEILLSLEYDAQSIKDFTTFCRGNDYGSPITINRFEQEYNTESAVWWYTFPSFIYSMLNGALRTLDANIIIKMGFFIHDLYHQIEQMYQNQICDYHGEPFIVYRGQGLPKKDFERLQRTVGGLLSFNNFLSTSKIEELALGFAKGAPINTDMVSILFKITIDPSVSSAPFASIQEVSQYQTEQEILFSMHTIFRIGEITKIDNDSSLYQVDLKLTADDDEQLRILTNYIREETANATAWDKLSVLLVKTGHLDKAEELFAALLAKTSDENEKACYFNNLGYVKNIQGKYEMAISFYEEAFEINRRLLPANHPNLAVSYNNIGSIYHNMEQFAKALSFYEKALDIREKTLRPEHPAIATLYNNIGGVYSSMGDHSKALSFYEKAGEILQKTLPVNHPLYATTYNNIGAMYDTMKDHSKALSFYETALAIREQTLPPNHPVLATSYSNIGGVYNSMGDHPKALHFYEKDLRIRESIHPSNHPDLVGSYMNVGLTCDNAEEYSKAFQYFERAPDIKRKTLPPNHTDLCRCYNNIGSVYENMGEYSKAQSYFERALEIQQKTLRANHPSLATSYIKIGEMYNNMGEYSKGLSYYERALDIKQQSLPPNCPSLASSYNNIGCVYNNMGEYSKALLYFERALNIEQQSLPANHPSLATSYNNIGLVYTSIGEYSKALSYFERALEIQQKTLPVNHPSLATSYNNIGSVYTSIEEYSKALSSFECALNIEQQSLSANHPFLATSYIKIGGVYQNMGEYSKAQLYFERALEIQQKTLPVNHPSLATSYIKIGGVYQNMGEYSKALSSFECARDLWQRSLPLGHPHLKSVEESIETVKKKL